MTSEALIGVIEDRVRDEIGDVGAACLMALTDRGDLTIRELPSVARTLRVERDLPSIVGVTIDTFARLAGITEGGR
jgi:hypothetical protein